MLTLSSVLHPHHPHLIFKSPQTTKHPSHNNRNPSTWAHQTEKRVCQRRLFIATAMSMSSSPRPSTGQSGYLPGMPPSPTASYTSTAVPPSTLNLQLPSSSPPIPQDILSRADVAHSIVAYENLLTTAKTYRKALATVSAAVSSFGAALEACARCMYSKKSPITPPPLPTLCMYPQGT